MIYLPRGLHPYKPQGRKAESRSILYPGPTTTPERGIYLGDARELGKHIADNSVDCIFTDPPYLREYMHLYGWLAEWASRVLKPDGFLMTYVGHFWKDDTMVMMRSHLEYFWDFTAIGSGAAPVMWNRRVVSRAKSILCYRKPGSKGLPRTNVLSTWTGSGEDKRYHAWGQDESTARYYIDCFSRRGDLVVDPFVGGGTTPYICAQLERQWLGFEINAEFADRSRARLQNIQAVLPFYELKDDQMKLDLITTDAA